MTPALPSLPKEYDQQKVENEIRKSLFSIFDQLGISTTNITNSTPIGGMIDYAGASISDPNWLICDGSAVSRTTYSALFGVIGTTYGIGDGSTTFNVPDMRAATSRGVGTSTIFTQNNTIALGQVVNDQIGPHAHSVSVPYGNVQGSTNNVSRASGNAGIDTTTLVVIGQPTGARTGNETTGKAIGLNKIIRAL